MCSLVSILVCVLFFTFCSTTQKIYLLSYENLDGKRIPENIQSLAGEKKEGKDCGFSYSLAGAFKNAVANTDYDTIIEAEVTHTTGPFAPMHCILVKGFAMNSNTIPKEDQK
ncbi:hypothetical protein A0128_17095 [Leptospira tipperaryensis]|uniref:TRL-like family protein n=2 Tax=Leptospira tipperaryensis TaxID=2564040 RepID=A0A1D7V2T7_9LEPT|nr:hypothetical protein A0128_17095 [Leptospira tipperaryensis]